MVLCVYTIKDRAPLHIGNGALVALIHRFYKILYNPLPVFHRFPAIPGAYDENFFNRKYSIGSKMEFNGRHLPLIEQKFLFAQLAGDLEFNLVVFCHSELPLLIVN